MEKRSILQDIQNYIEKQEELEKAPKTIKQYNQVLNDFVNRSKIIAKEEITKDVLIKYKQELLSEQKKTSVNNKIVIVNKFLDFIQLDKTLHLRQERLQQVTSLENGLTKKEYEHLKDYTKKNNMDLEYYILVCFGGTGIRSAELKFITVENVKSGKIVITNKGKTRIVPIAKAVQKELLDYAKKQNIKSGIIFKSKYGKVYDQAYIYRKLKVLGGKIRSGFKKDKLHLHNLRHYFAKTCIDNGLDISTVADILGHSDLNTTRIYCKKTIAEQRDLIDKMLK